MQAAVSALHDHSKACEDADQLGRDLYALNCKAVAVRYPDDDNPQPEDFAEWRWKGNGELRTPCTWHSSIPANLAAACRELKALQCLKYQLGEGEEVPATALYDQITKHIHAMTAAIVGLLPEYDAAPWS
jgi:hypothetical protein